MKYLSLNDQVYIHGLFGILVYTQLNQKKLRNSLNLQNMFEGLFLCQV